MRVAEQFTMAGLDKPATEVVARVARAANLGAVLVVVAVLALAESRQITVFLASFPKQKKGNVLIKDSRTLGEEIAMMAEAKPHCTVDDADVAAYADTLEPG